MPGGSRDVAIGEGDTAAVRITLQAKALGTVDYENEYALFVQARDGLIERVWEYVDMQARDEPARTRTPVAPTPASDRWPEDARGGTPVACLGGKLQALPAACSESVAQRRPRRNGR